ncbi:MAG: helix-hairpin-helix domain-containing protein [Deltaproteobacteria bacterium]|nr:helix-hairpin-helix domain-containing protein [Deltaproteobacteria bacterium]TLN04051.1 MAG: helix-hairpin-helix domain-containing protein [bacterium]
MKKSVAGVFLGMVALLLAATVSFAAPEEGITSAETTKSVTKKVRKKSADQTSLIDINSASPEQLATLPGLTGEDAKKIIASRPYTRKNQLKQKNIITAATYDGIKKLIVAKRQKNL